MIANTYYKRFEQTQMIQMINDLITTEIQTIFRPVSVNAMTFSIFESSIRYLLRGS